MAAISIDHPWAFIFGLLGNFISFLVYLAPLPTFYRVYQKKSTEGFHSVPYVAALFSAMLWIFYALLKTNAALLITINSFGCFIETAYIVMFIIYATKKARVFTVKICMLLNVGIFGAILICTLSFSKGTQRAEILGWICMIFSVTVFVAPLSIIRLVIRTKSVEFMPFSLSFFLTLSAVVWFMYGLLKKDLYVAVPNVLGFIFGIMQMVLYIAYKEKKKIIQDPTLPHEHIVTNAKLGVLDNQVYTIDVKASANDEENNDTNNNVDDGDIEEKPQVKIEEHEHCDETNVNIVFVNQECGMVDELKGNEMVNKLQV